MAKKKGFRPSNPSDEVQEVRPAQLISRPRLREIYVNYPNDSPLIIRTMVDECVENDRRVNFDFVLYLRTGETQIEGLRRVAQDILEKVR